MDRAAEVVVGVDEEIVAGADEEVAADVEVVTDGEVAVGVVLGKDVDHANHMTGGQV